MTQAQESGWTVDDKRGKMVTTSTLFCGSPAVNTHLKWIKRVKTNRHSRVSAPVCQALMCRQGLKNGGRSLSCSSSQKSLAHLSGFFLS